MKPYLKFGLLIGVIIGVIVWLAVGGVNETKTYYKTISELHHLSNQGLEHNFRVAGDVAENSIVRNGHEVQFTLSQDCRKAQAGCAADGPHQQFSLKVVYAGIEPLPDTFKPGAQALADGRLGPDGVFHADKVQAKCASKYEAKPPQRVASQKASL